MSMCLLSIKRVWAGYEGRHVLKDVSLDVAASEIVAVLGHNGAGKSTLLRTVFGLVRPSLGAVHISGMEPNRSPAEVVRHGVVYVPQGATVFPNLSVEDNLRIRAVSVLSKNRIEDGVGRVLRTIPMLNALRRQRAGNLSGGEQQIVALGSTLLLEPRLLLLDEPTLGLAAGSVSDIITLIRRFRDEMATSILLVEQRLSEALVVSDRVCVLRQGAIVHDGPARELGTDLDAMRRLLS